MANRSGWMIHPAWMMSPNAAVLSSLTVSLSSGQDVGELLPNVEELLAAPQLAELADSAVFRFLLQAVYEHVRALANQDDGR